MTLEECRTWIQTGLALTPFCGYIMNTFLECAAVWSLWINGSHLFPSPKSGQDQAIPTHWSLHMTNDQVPTLYLSRIANTYLYFTVSLKYDLGGRDQFFPKAAAKGSFKKSVVIKDCL